VLLRPTLIIVDACPKFVNFIILISSGSLAGLVTDKSVLANANKELFRIIPKPKQDVVQFKACFNKKI
jgi:hypothetical protein